MFLSNMYIYIYIHIYIYIYVCIYIYIYMCAARASGGAAYKLTDKNNYNKYIKEAK